MTLPVVVDLRGAVRDWAYLRAKYGNVTYLAAAGYPKFQLSVVEEMEGPQTLIVTLLNDKGVPHSGQPEPCSRSSLSPPPPARSQGRLPPPTRSARSASKGF